MSIKLLIAAESNGGKTTLTKDLQNALVVSHDGKKYPYPVPHVMVDTFDSVQELITLTNDKIVAYKERYKAYPKTVVFDSVSKIFDTLLDTCNIKHTGFKIYSELDKEIHEFTDYVQNTLIASDMNVILISHALYDAETTKYNLIGKGNFQKRGGFLAEVDQALFIETKNNKRILHFRSTKFPARTLRAEDPDSIPVDDFNLQDYLDALASEQQDVDEFAI
jgi:hypothetical protein